MRMRAIPKPSVLVAGALEDKGRFIFILKSQSFSKSFATGCRIRRRKPPLQIIKRKATETEMIELPHAIIPQGSDPVSALAEIFLSQLGIDAQIHEVIHETRHNAGSRKNKRWITVLVFRITAKNAFAKPAPGIGFAWLSLEDAGKKRLSRNAEWLKNEAFFIS